MPKDQLIIGCLIAALCGLGLWHRNWLLNETGKGQWLVKRWGLLTASRIITILLVIGLVGGVLLACNILRPLRW